MIAQEAGVSIPTVYKYFPTRDDLIPACTGLVASKGAGGCSTGASSTASETVPERVQALARALFRLHEYYGPWIRWTDADAAEIPALREYPRRRPGRRGSSSSGSPSAPTERSLRRRRWSSWPTSSWRPRPGGA
jgi:AcrR family transcriptional regulator